ncbi:MAG: hypothetical protein KDD44_02620 [Bdellovibrionales bacterium]|nr:hypothetical protein [Bdellovibrionales bacterium]
MSTRKDGLPDNVEIIDPVGEIRRRAKELYEADGSPAERTWTEYFAEAEEDFLGGSTCGATPGRQRAHQRAKKSLDPELEKLLASKDASAHARVLASALKQPTKHHESICVGLILQTHTMSLQDGRVLSPLTASDAATVLALLAGEYDAAFCKDHGVAEGRLASLDARSGYWKTLLEAQRAADQALTNADRNTVERLRAELIADGTVVKMTF